MNNQESVFVEALMIRESLAEYRDKKYEGLIKQLNTRASEILRNDLGSIFVQNCGRDLAGEVVRNFFNTSDYYITVDQLANRILKFDYENEYDPLKENGNADKIKKDVNNQNDKMSSTIENITKEIKNSNEKLFKEERATDSLDRKGKTDYRRSRETDDGELYDELTGRKGNTATIIQNGKEVKKSDLHADHIQAREAAVYNKKYVTEEGVERLRAFWNSADNMQLIHASANTSKGDVRVCEVDGKILYKNPKEHGYDPTADITHRATPEQLAEATISQWKKGDIGSDKIKTLKENGYLVDDGEGGVIVPESVRKMLVQNIRHSQNEESKKILENLNQKKIAKDSMAETKKAVGKILAGQIIYYAAPPLVYEVRCILKNRGIGIKEALKQLKDSGKRVCKYISSHLYDIFKNVIGNSVKKFIKTFIDFLIELVKSTVKKMLRVVKSLVLSVVDAVKIIAAKGATPAQKADSVFNLFGVTVTNCVLEIIFECIEKGLNIPEFILMPLQILASVICSNLVMLVLKKADIFHVNTGFNENAIKKLFEDSNREYNMEMKAAAAYADANMDALIERAKNDFKMIRDDLMQQNVWEKSVRETLNNISNMFCMNIEFDSKWNEFVNKKFDFTPEVAI